VLLCSIARAATGLHVFYYENVMTKKEFDVEERDGSWELRVVHNTRIIIMVGEFIFLVLDGPSTLKYCFYVNLYRFFLTLRVCWASNYRSPVAHNYCLRFINSLTVIGIGFLVYINE